MQLSQKSPTKTKCKSPFKTSHPNILNTEVHEKTYPGAPPSPLKGLKQHLVRMDDSLPCRDLLSFHEKLGTSTIAFLMVQANGGQDPSEVVAPGTTPSLRDLIKRIKIDFCEKIMTHGKKKKKDHILMLAQEVNT